MNRTINRLVAALAAFGAAVAIAQQPRSTIEEIERYRAALGDGNPAELWEMRGEELWKQKRGPKNASLEKCDLGLGPGVVKGAYTVLPKYFADTDKVEDLESRLVTCMETLQGMSRKEAIKDWYKADSEIESLVTYVAAQSKGEKIDVPATHPAEAQLYAVGYALFFRRSGPLDFRMENVPDRLAAHGDIWSDIERDKQDLEALLAAGAGRKGRA